MGRRNTHCLEDIDLPQMNSTYIWPLPSVSNKSQELLEAGKKRDFEKCKRLLTGWAQNPFDVNLASDDKAQNTCILYLLLPLERETDSAGNPYYSAEQLKELPAIIRRLVECHANVNYQNSDGRSALGIACNEIAIEIVADMVEVFAASQEGLGDPNLTSEQLKELIDYRLRLMPDPNRRQNVSKISSKFDGGTLWELAVRKDSFDILQLLLDAQVALRVQWKYWRTHPNTKTKYNFEDKKNKMVDITNKRGNPQAWEEDGSPLHVVIKHAQNEDTVYQFIRCMLDDYSEDDEAKDFLTLFDSSAVDGNGMTALHLTCQIGYEQCIGDILRYRLYYGEAEKSISKPIDVNMQCGRDKVTALMLAVSNGHTPAVRELFESNNLVKQRHDLTLRRAHDRMTVLHIASSHRQELDEVVSILCKNKAEVNLKDSRGFSPLHLSCLHGHVSNVRILLNYNANSAALTNDGKETAIHIAAAYGYINITSILIRKGGSQVAKENEDGETPLHHAFKYHTFISNEAENIIMFIKKKDLLDPSDLNERGIGNDIQKFLKIYERRAGRNNTAHLASTNEHKKDLQKNLLFKFDSHPSSPHSALQQLQSKDPSEVIQERFEKEGLAGCLTKLETKFLEINNQNMLIKLLLGAGCELDHEDNTGEPAFITTARFDWFYLHEDEMTEIYDRPNEIGYDSEIFMDRRTQLAVETAYVGFGLRTEALQKLLIWVATLVLLTFVGIRYSGRNSYEAFSLEAGIKDRVANDEWDEYQTKTLADVGTLDEWSQYVPNVFIESLWESGQAYVDTNGDLRNVGDHGALLNGLIGLLGRPRYRQLRTSPTGCNSSTPSILIETEETCFLPATRQTYQPAFHSIQDRVPFTCPLSNGTNLELTWDEHPSFPVFGQYGFYHSGGFSVTLPKNRTEVDTLFQDLMACDYVSLNTRFAVLEFTLYSRSQGLFTHGLIFLELTAAGGIVPGQRWHTCKLVSYNSDQDKFDIIAEILLLIAFVYYMYCEFDAMFSRWDPRHIQVAPKFWQPEICNTEKATKFYIENPKTYRVSFRCPCTSKSLCFKKTDKTIQPYWINPFNYVDVCVMTLFISLLIVHGYLVAAVDSRLDYWYSLSNSEEYVDVSHLIWFATVRQHLLAVIVFLCYIKCLEHLQVSATMAIPVIIIGGMLRQLVSFFTIFVVFLMAFGLFDYILYGLTYEPSSSVLRSIIMAFRNSLGDIDFDGKYELDHTVGLFMTVFSASLLVILLLNLLIAIMNEAYEDIKESAEARWCYIQFRMIVANQRSRKAFQDISQRLDSISSMFTLAADGNVPNGDGDCNSGDDVVKMKEIQVPSLGPLQTYHHDSLGLARKSSDIMRVAETPVAAFLRDRHTKQEVDDQIFDSLTRFLQEEKLREEKRRAGGESDIDNDDDRHDNTTSREAPKSRQRYISNNSKVYPQ